MPMQSHASGVRMVVLGGWMVTDSVPMPLI